MKTYILIIFTFFLIRFPSAKAQSGTFDGSFACSEIQQVLVMTSEGYGIHYLTQDDYYLFRYWPSGEQTYQFQYYGSQPVQMTITELPGIGFILMDSEYNTYSYERQGEHGLSAANIVDIKGYFPEGVPISGASHPSAPSAPASSPVTGRTTSTDNAIYDPDRKVFDGRYFCEADQTTLQLAPNGYGLYLDHKDNKTVPIKYWHTDGEHEYTIQYFGGDEAEVLISPMPGIGLSIVDAAYQNYSFEARGRHGISESDMQQILQLMAEPEPRHFGPIGKFDQLSQPDFFLPYSPSQSNRTTLTGYFETEGGFLDLSPSGTFRGKNKGQDKIFTGIYHLFPEQGYIRYFTTDGDTGEDGYQLMGNTLTTISREVDLKSINTDYLMSLLYDDKDRQPEVEITSIRYRKLGPSRQSEEEVFMSTFDARHFFFRGKHRFTPAITLDGCYSALDGTQLEFTPYGVYRVIQPNQQVQSEGIYAIYREGGLEMMSAEGIRNIGKLLPQSNGFRLDLNGEITSYRYQGPTTIRQEEAAVSRAHAINKYQRFIMAMSAADRAATKEILNNWTDNTIYVNQYGERVY